MKTMKEQCEERGVDIATLLGKTAAEVRTMGYEVRADCPEHYVLVTTEMAPPIPAARVILGQGYSAPTGYVWVGKDTPRN